jgi:translation initiation factor IF-1
MSVVGARHGINDKAELGDRVRVEMSPSNLGRGRVSYRYR